MSSEKVYAYIYDNGEIKNEYISTDNLPSDYEKYTNEEGDIYVYKDYDRPGAPRTLTTKEKWAQMIKGQEVRVQSEKIIEEDNKSSSKSDIKKTKKLGIFHTVYTYIFMPLSLLSVVLTLIGEVYVSIAERIFHMGVTPDIFILIMNVLCTALACVALIKRDRYAYHWTVAKWITHTIYELQSDVGTLIAEPPSGQWIPLCSIASLIIGILICRYYYNRQHLLKDDIYRGLIAAPEKVAKVYYIASMMLGLYVYQYSVFHMFKASIVQGLIGLLLPGIGQIIYLHTAGLTSAYAYMCYNLFFITAGAKAFLLIAHTKSENQ